MNDGNQWVDLTNQGPVVVVLVTIISGFLRRWWVTGREYDEMKDTLTNELNYWRAAASRTAGMAETAIDAQTQRRAEPHERS